MDKILLEKKLQEIFSGLFNKQISIENLTPLSGGASADTWLFDVAYFNNNKDEKLELILRSSSTGDVAFGAGIDKNTEAKLQQAAYENNVPVAKVIYTLKESDEIGMGYIMERHEGETIARKILRDEKFSSARKQMATQCGEILAGIHAIDIKTLPQLPDQSAEPQVKQMKALYKSLGEPVPVFDLAIQWLEDHLPEQQTLKLVHGDFRNGNFIVDENGLKTILDWELSHFGDPLEDLGWLCVNSWRFGEIDKPVGGFGQREDLYKSYEAASGQKVNVESVKFWEVFGTFKWGVICLYQTFAHLNGQVRSVERAAIGRRVSETEIDILRLISPSNTLANIQKGEK
jgi:aminoglycoside phosphotransferase (APT) family kinase protein